MAMIQLPIYTSRHVIACLYAARAASEAGKHTELVNCKQDERHSQTMSANILTGAGAAVKNDNAHRQIFEDYIAKAHS